MRPGRMAVRRGMPARESKDFKSSTRRLLRRGSHPSGCARRACVLLLAVVSVTLLGHRRRGPRPRHQHHRRRASSGDGHRLRRAAPTCSWSPGALRRRRPCWRYCRRYLLAGIVQRRCSACARRRGQAQPHAARLRRPPAARRPAEPGHQRHRQPRPEPPADAEPDAHVDADARRRAHHDDHRSRRCSRSSRSSRSRSRSSRCRSITKRSKTKFVAQWRHTGDAERAGRGGVHRALAGEGVRSPAEVEAPVQRARTKSSSRRASARSSSPAPSSRR